MKYPEYERILPQLSEPNHRALNLLFSWLDKFQLEDMKNYGWFEVRGSDKKWYRVDQSHNGNVKLIRHPHGPVSNGWCLVPKRDIPVFDHMLIAKLMLETNAREFRMGGAPYRVGVRGWELFDAFKPQYTELRYPQPCAAPWILTPITNELVTDELSSHKLIASLARFRRRFLRR